VVGRELLTICPDGEDHQGHDRGDRVGDEGCSGWRKRNGSKRLKVRRIAMIEMCGLWILLAAPDGWLTGIRGWNVPGQEAQNEIPMVI
jgi:hypothetical protein